MKPASPAQFQEALALIRRTQDHARQIRVLESLTRAHGNLANARRREQFRLTDFIDNPDLLAGLLARIRRADPAFVKIADTSYRFLLSQMREQFDTGKPLRVDFHALDHGARPYLLAPFLDLAIGGRFPRLCLESSDPDQGRLTYISAHGAPDRAVLTARLPDIQAWLGGNWRLASTSATSFTLERRQPLPASIPFDPAWLRKGALLLGIDTETHAPAYMRFDLMTHMLVAGTPGMGKSSFLHVLMRSCLNSADEFHAIHAICGQGIAFESYRGLHPKLHVASEPEELFTLAADLQQTMKQRIARLIAEKRDKMDDYILVVIDEWGAFNQPERHDKQSREAHAAFLQNMLHLGKRGRKVGIRLVIVVQEPVERDLSPGLKSTLASMLSFRLPLTQHATALFGEITPPAVPADPRTLPIGEAIFHSGRTGQRTGLKIPFLEPPGRAA